MDALSAATVIAALVIGLFLGLSLGRSSGRRAEQARSAALEVEVGLLRERVTEGQAQRSDDAKVSSLIEGLEKRVKEFQEKADQADRDRLKAESEIRQRLADMSTYNASLVSQTTKLADALTNSSKRGQLGEMQLEQLLEHSGLRKDVNYRKQTTNEEGRKPDYIINLPGGGEIIVDSKFPFARFWEAAEESDPARQKALYAEHAADLLKHADALTKRGYHHSNTTPDFVVLFAPFESILSIALDADSLLLEKMFAKNVVMATPTTMLALVRTIAYGYSQRYMAENAEKIRDLAAQLLKRTVLVHSKLATLGDRLRSTANAYGDLVATADNSIFVPARKMVALGVPTPKAISGLETEVPIREFQPRAALTIAGAEEDGSEENGEDADLFDEEIASGGEDQ